MIQKPDVYMGSMAPSWGENKKIKNVHDYNCDMSKLYIKCSLFFVLAGIICIICIWLGVTCIMVGSTLGIYIVWKKYKNILSKYV